jgi:hypothetical protein
MGCNQEKDEKNQVLCLGNNRAFALLSSMWCSIVSAITAWFDSRLSGLTGDTGVPRIKENIRKDGRLDLPQYKYEEHLLLE